MTQVTIDAATIAKLNAVPDREFAVCDDAGNVVGWYAPARQPTMQEVIDSCPTSEEELQRRIREEVGSGRTWSEIRRDLEAS